MADEQARVKGKRSSGLHPAAVLNLLANATRLRVFASVVLGADTVEDIVTATGLRAAEVRRSLKAMTSAGLVQVRRGRISVELENIASAAETISARPDPGIEVEDERMAVELSKFFRDGRLHTIPAARPKRVIVLDYLASRFEPGRYYTEKEVNQTIRQYHDDVATLRRFLVDEGFLERRSGRYWRTGGSFDVD